MRFKAVLCLLCLALFIAFSCRQRTEEDAVLEVVDCLSRLAGEKNIEGMMALFSADFSDFEGRDKDGLRSLLSNYFSGRTGIVVHALSRRILDLEIGYAELETEVALSSGGVEALRRLVRVSPDIYRIRIELIKDGERWLISFAEWSWMSLTELVPESLSALKKFFPKL